MKTKLLFAISQLYRGGAETSLVNLLSHLDKEKYDIDLVIMNQSPVANAVSLIGQVPSYVKLCNAYGRNGVDSLLVRAKAKFIYTDKQKSSNYSTALDFVRNKKYDWAFAVGEWCSPEFVADEVTADHKAAWMHNDLSLAEYFDPDLYFEYADRFDKFIFVSENSLKETLREYPFLKDKSYVIYNINDVDKIRNYSSEPVSDYTFSQNMPTLITCANFRQQKNHLRQVEVMAELFRRGVKFNWVNIGALTDSNIVESVRQKTLSLGLQDNFFILGPKDNPYKYISRADAVAVLSDYESWSMVITEAKILGVPVISTRTSGALEQIEHKKNGILTDFRVDDIADKIEEFLTSKSLRDSIRKELNGFDNTKQILDSFDGLVLAEEPARSDNRILYIIDDINYVGGAHIATKYQINYLLSKGQDITIFSGNTPNYKVRNELAGVKFISWFKLRQDKIYNARLMDVLTGKNYSKEEKKFKWAMTSAAKLDSVPDVFKKMVIPRLSELFSEYDTICVMSEGSEFKPMVAESSARKKIQWVHIDYCYWKQTNDWAIERTKDDKELWEKFDNIVVLTENIRQSVAMLYPNIADKLLVFKNLMPVEKIKKMSEPRNKLVKFVTVGRLDKQKAYDRLIPILSRLYKEGYDFKWDIYGGGPEYEFINCLIGENGLGEIVKLHGNTANPFRYVKNADVFALMSDFEGLPNTIYESLILGVPVLATNTGGVKEQVITGETGWLVDNTKTSVYEGIRHVLDNTDEIGVIRQKISKYEYGNDKICADTLKLFTTL